VLFARRTRPNEIVGVERDGPGVRQDEVEGIVGLRDDINACDLESRSVQAFACAARAAEQVYCLLLWIGIVSGGRISFCAASWEFFSTQ
jgi:hypothetical protein